MENFKQCVIKHLCDDETDWGVFYLFLTRADIKNFGFDTPFQVENPDGKDFDLFPVEVHPGYGIMYNFGRFPGDTQDFIQLIQYDRIDVLSKLPEEECYRLLTGGQELENIDPSSEDESDGGWYKSAGRDYPAPDEVYDMTHYQDPIF